MSGLLADADGGVLAATVESLYARFDETDLHHAKAPASASSGAAVYGELTTPVRLFEALSLCRDDTFADLGSGRGQVCVAAAAHIGCNVLGVEFARDRCAPAFELLERVAPPWRDRTTLVCADALTYDLRDATKVLLTNATFEDALNAKFAAALHPSRAPRVQKVATLKPLSREAREAAALHLAAITVIGGSWAPSGTPLHVYDRATPGVPPASPVCSAELLRLLREDREEEVAEEARALGRAEADTKQQQQSAVEPAARTARGRFFRRGRLRMW